MLGLDAVNFLPNSPLTAMTDSILLPAFVLYAL